MAQTCVTVTIFIGEQPKKRPRGIVMIYDWVLVNSCHKVKVDLASAGDHSDNIKRLGDGLT